MSGVVVIRSLNDEGTAHFARTSWNKDRDAAEPPTQLLHDDRYSEPHIFDDGKTRSIESGLSFDSHLALAEAIDSCLGSDQSSKKLKGERGLWSWFSLLFYRELRSQTRPGLWKKAAQPRFIPSGKGNSYYRHNVFMPYHMLRRFGAQKAAVFLEGAKDTTVWPEVNEQLLSTNLTRNCDSLIEAATKLYYDESTTKVKLHAGSDGDGSARRLRTVFSQFYETYDMMSMTSEQILDILPSEFDRFKQGGGPE